MTESVQEHTLCILCAWQMITPVCLLPHASSLFYSLSKLSSGAVVFLISNNIYIFFLFILNPCCKLCTPPLLWSCFELHWNMFQLNITQTRIICVLRYCSFTHSKMINSQSCPRTEDTVYSGKQEQATPAPWRTAAYHVMEKHHYCRDKTEPMWTYVHSVKLDTCSVFDWK